MGLKSYRYPTFQSALADIDDALSTLHLYKTTSPTNKITAEMIEDAERICHEFDLYVIKSHSLRKTFISIRGYYLQAMIGGVTVTWTVPHSHNNKHVRKK